MGIKNETICRIRCIARCNSCFVVDHDGDKLWEGDCASTPEAIGKTVKERAPDVIRIGLQSGHLSIWHWHGLKDMELSTICIDAYHAHGVLRLQMNKTDKNDAHGIILMTSIFDSTDGPNDYDFPINSTSGSGDIKRQECMYVISEAPDGDIVISGNSSGNKDDNYMVKVRKRHP